MKTIKFLAFALLSVCFSLPVKAQLSVKNAFEIISAITIPYEGSKNCLRTQSFGIENPNNVMPDKLYKDFQCTDYILARSNAELGPAIYAKFEFAKNLLVGAVSFGGSIELHTTVLIVVDDSGNIKSTLLAEVACGLITSKQYRITEDGKVIISTLVPTSSTSIKFDSFSNLSAYRLDETYVVDSSGQFKKETETKYNTKTYTKSQLDTLEYDIWDL